MVLGVALLAAIVLGGLLGMWIIRDSGYVMISYGQTAVETSLWVAIAGLILIYLVIRGIAYLVRVTLSSQTQVLNWRSSRKAKTARQQTIRGMLFMAEGRWEEAKKALLNAAPRIETPLINYLQAARSAHELGEADERDELLKLAHETTPGAKFAATLTQAEFQMHDGRYEQALAALLTLRKRVPKHKTVLAMLGRCYEQLGDWQALHEILPELADRKAVQDAEIKRWSRQVWEFMMTGSDPVSSLWKKMPKTLKADEEFLQKWVELLVTDDRNDDAVELMQLILDHVWIAEVVAQYGQTVSSDAARQLIHAQGWAKSRPSDPELLITLGRLSMMAKEFGKAREYFDASLRLSPSSAVYAELGRLCVAMGGERRGRDYLLQSLSYLPRLPLPETPTIRG